MARKAVAQELSRERILAEARELFATFGYRALTMRSIAKAMGYSHGALYYHFNEKAELFYALIKEDFSELVQRQREMIVREQGFSVNLLQKLMMEFVWFGLNNPNHYEMMFMINEPELQQYSRTEQAQCLEMFAIVIRQVMADQPGAESGSLHFRGICLCLYMALFPIAFSLNNPTRMRGNWLKSISVLSVLAWI